MTLPIDDIFPQLAEALLSSSRVILQAPPGAGKSTRLPLLLLQTGQFNNQHKIIILEPRRVAARQIATYLSSQLKQKIGQQIGLVMRGENKTSQDTVITIMTDGVLVRQLQNDPELNNIALVIFDEYHERALQTDLALALTLDAQELNETVKVLIMSATLDLQALSTSLDAPVVESDGRQYPVTLEYVNATATTYTTPSIDDICRTVDVAINSNFNNQQSSVLVFLSGIGEINRVQQRLNQTLPAHIKCYPLFGGLTIEQQANAIKPAEKGMRKIVLATNIAQTSLTIDGVDIVVDAGIEKVMVYQPKLKSEQLVTQQISQASSVQRMGRAGRLRAGLCYRLGSQENFDRRRKHDTAEIERVDLAQLLLEVHLWGAQFNDLFWLTKPEPFLLNVAQQKLQGLGYLESGYLEQGVSGLKVSNLANQYQNIGAGLRLSKMLLKAAALQNSSSEQSGLLPTACVLAALIEHGRASNNESDLTAQIEKMDHYTWSQLSEFINRYGKRFKLAKIQKSQLEPEHIGLLLALAFPDRIAKNIAKKIGKQWKLSNGVGVQFHPNQVEPSAELIVIAQFNAGQYGQYVQSYAAVSLTEIQEVLPELIVSEDKTGWSDALQKPYQAQQVKIGELVLSEKAKPLTLTPEGWQQIWLDYIKQKGLNCLNINESTDVLIKKLQLVAEHLPQNSSSQDNASQKPWPDFSYDSLFESLFTGINNPQNWLVSYLADVKSVAQLKKLNITDILLNSMDWSLQQELQKACPDTYKTPAGSSRKIDYLADTPKLSAKLQEMFGDPTSPAICHGKQPLLIELLSPAQRPLQVTQDLVNFWNNAYQDVKKEMKGRYPKHPWPDDPINFVATSKTKSQLNR
ncbi:ATP-dependent helicase HrpB [uncultured Psychrosphaera sp.]|uniref:ATP-dependent helicase HrpB n=1 Tax=uncultured Psychrosphaera sp. TaxID=1403522 RepID=UPI0026370D65|nr:ATP-dependent helicase HrpB [uncultured Psychrosphaera sp.]